jgi:hypothetical protein
MESLCELLDALEAGLLQMRRERDELRETVERSAVRKVAKKRPAPAKPRARKQAKLQAEPPTEPQKPKAPAKTRQALGRTLNQIRRAVE